MIYPYLAFRLKLVSSYFSATTNSVDSKHQRSTHQNKHLLSELLPPESGKKSVVISDDDYTKVVLFAFAAGAGLAEHVAPLPAIMQIIQGEAQLTVGDEKVAGKVGTWIQMEAKTPQSILATSPVVMLLTLIK